MPTYINENNKIEGDNAYYQCGYNGGECTLTVNSTKNGVSQPFTVSPMNIGSWLTVVSGSNTITLQVTSDENLTSDNTGNITLTQNESNRTLCIHATQKKKEVDPTDDLRNISVRLVCAKGDDLTENARYAYLSKTDGDDDFVVRTFEMIYGNGAFRYGSDNYSESLDESKFVTLIGTNLKHSTEVTTFNVTIDDRSKRQEIYDWLQNENSKTQTKAFNGSSNFYIKDINGTNPYPMNQTSFYAYRGSCGASGGSIRNIFIAGPLPHDFIKESTYTYSTIPQLNVTFIAQPQGSAMGRAAIVKLKLTDSSSSAINGITGQIEVKIKYVDTSVYQTKTINLVSYAGNSSEILVSEFGSTLVEKFVKKNDNDNNTEADVSITTKIRDTQGRPIEKIVIQGTTTTSVDSIQPWYFENEIIQEAD